MVGWTPDGKILYSTQHFSTLPNTQLATIDPATNATTVVPLAQASDGAYTADGALIFTRLPFQGSHTRLYHGGTAQQLWRYDRGAAEAVPLTGDYAGTSKNPMIWQDRVYFLSDRDGTMNLWSMNEHGGELKQLTHNTTFDAQSASLSDGRIAYQLGADIHLYDIASGRDQVVPITLVSDFDQTRERWVKSPTEWIGSSALSPNGDRIVFTARGDVFVVPVKQGRIVDVTPTARVRYRDASFLPDGKSLLTLSDQSGEFEFWRAPADGIGSSTQLTHGATVLRWAGVPSPDGALDGALRQEPRALAARHEAGHRPEDRHRHGGRLRQPVVVTGQQVAGVFRARFQPAHPALPLQHCERPHHAAHQRPLRQLRPDLEP